MTKSLTYVEVDIPDFAPTQILLNFNSSPVVDEGLPRVWTLAGNAFIDTADKKFGAASLKCDGTTDTALTSDSPDFTLGTSDFTFDVFFKVSATVSGNRWFAGQLDVAGDFNNSSFLIGRGSTDRIFVQVFQTGSSPDNIVLTGTTQFTNAINPGWHHAAFVRSGTTLMLFLDGIMESSSIFIGPINNSAALLGAGGGGSFTTNTWEGWIDAFRMRIGTAYWISNFTPPTVEEHNRTTYRFAVDASYLPSDIPAIPSIKEVEISPAIISLGENLGQRANLTVTFRDHKHVFINELFDSGTFWGKFRKRYGLTLQGYNMRLIRGILGQPLANMETRHYVIDGANGPAANGDYKIIGKDMLTLADREKAQAPLLSNGFLVAGITNVATTFTLSPSGIGNTEYPASGHVNIGGKEICSFTRSGDTMTITRAQFNTTAVAHDAQERAQLCLRYTTQDVAVIIADLFDNYTDVQSSWIPLATWQAETAAYLATSYSALIAEPTSVSKLISELVEQAGLAIWWNEINRQINLQVLRPVATDAAVYNANNYIADSLTVTEQPEKRLSQVYTYFAKLSPLVNEDQINNYRSTAYSSDPASEALYGGTPAIKKIYSRWIPDGGRAIALTLNGVQLARFKDPPRRISFDVLRDSGVNPVIGVGYQIEGWPFQEITGAPARIAAQVTRLNPKADIFEVEAEEISASAFAGVGASPDVHTVIIDSNQTNVNMRTMHDSIYGAPISGQTINFSVVAGVFVGTASVGLPAMETGSWPGGVTINLTVMGRIQGAGGNGGIGRSLIFAAGTGTAGGSGGTALSVAAAINLTDTAGQIWGGGGGGGGATANGGNTNGCGGGGAGRIPGIHGGGDSFTTHGSDGTTEAGGAGGAASSGQNGGTGGNPGLAGTNGFNSGLYGNVGGPAGNSILGIGFVTTIGGAGDRRGPQT